MTSMTRHQTSHPFPPLYILDPGNFTPLYDINLASALGQRGWRPTWITSPHFRDDTALLQAGGANEAFFGFTRSHALRLLKSHPRLGQATKCASYPFYLAAFSNTLIVREPGIVHVQWALLPALDRLFWRRWRRCAWIVVYTVHDPKPLAGTLPQMLTWQQSRLWGEADAVIVHSKDAAAAVRCASIREDSLHIIPPGPPTLSSGVSRNEARATLNIPPKLPVILFFGYIKKYKGLEFLLRSLPPLQETLGPFLCIVAGEFKEPASRYRRLMSQLRLQHVLRLVEGYVPECSMPGYFSACDVVALPYLEASSSSVLLGAYAFGKPVVATAIGGNLELVEDGRSGYLVPPRDSVAMAKALAAVLKDPDKAMRMGIRGKEIIERRHSWEQIAERTEHVYLHLDSRRRRLSERTR